MAEWFIAKHIPDLRRREPTNVGLVLVGADRSLSRFIGQREDDSIDGRRLRWAASLSTYKAWVRFWSATAAGGLGAVQQAVAARRPDDSYFLESAGGVLAGSYSADIEGLFDELYEMLVETAEARTLNVRQLADTLLNQLAITDQVIADYAIELATPSGTRDSVSFDYRYDNGAAHLMQRVSLVYEDERSWDKAHAAAWSFEKIAGRQIDGKDVNTVALVKPRSDDKTLQRQLVFLSDYARLIDISDPDMAAPILSEVLHLTAP